jgi:DNA mismatch repair protein MutS2
MEYDDVADRPAFSLRYGTPGTSYAFEVARNQGIGQDLLARGRGYLNQDEVRLNRLIDKLNRLKYETEIEKSKAEHVREKYATARKRMLKVLEKAESDRKEILVEKRNEADQLIKEAREEIKILINSFKEKQSSSQAFVQERYDSITKRLIDKLHVPEDKGTPGENKLLKKGQLVRHRGLSLEGRILSIDTINSKAMIITGNVKLSVKTEDLIVISDGAGLNSDESAGGISHGISESPKKEINLIGYKVEEALPLIDRIIDRSMIEGNMSIRIVHGHGTGRLKAAIRDHLKGFSCVKRIAGEDPKYGGEAVTIVELN